MNLDRLIARISTHFGVEASDLRSTSKVSSVARARAALCYVGVRELGMTAAFIAKELGISPTTVSRAILRGPRALGSEGIEKFLECQ